MLPRWSSSLPWSIHSGSGGAAVSGVCVQIDHASGRNVLDLPYTGPECHDKGLGQQIWQAVGARYPDTKVWETRTPCFEKRNIHF